MINLFEKMNQTSGRLILAPNKKDQAIGFKVFAVAGIF